MHSSEKRLSKKESFLSKFTIRTVLLVSMLLVGGMTFVHAQGFSPYFGLGSATDSAGTSAGCPSKFLFDDFTNFCEPGPKIGGVFGVFGADFMLRPKFGVNGEYAFRFAQADYLPFAQLKFRPSFYDFNAIYQPVSSKRIAPVIEGGIGGARIALYFTQSASVTGVNTTVSQFFASANHFQVHGAFGVKLYVKPNLFIKPQFDIHYVTHLTDQFGHDWVPQYTVAVGYTFGEH
jgi:hypothetical protein